MERDTSIARIAEGIRELVHVPQLARLFVTLMADRRVPIWLKISAGSGILYVVSPIDVIPDRITGIRYLDDVIVGLLIVQTFIEMAPKEVVQEHCARLSIAPESLQVNVSKAVAAAIGALLPLLEGRHAENGSAPRPSATPGRYSADEPSKEDQPSAALEAHHSRYSAFRPATAQE